MTPSEWLDQPVRITDKAVYIGEHELPGVIAQDGVTIYPGNGDFNRMVVEFYVGEVTVDRGCADGHVKIMGEYPEWDNPELTW